MDQLGEPSFRRWGFPIALLQLLYTRSHTVKFGLDLALRVHTKLKLMQTSFVKILLLLFLGCASIAYADTSEPFLEGIKDVVKLDFSDGSRYEGQVKECLIGGKKTMCFEGMGVYTSLTGYSYEGEFKDNKPNGQGLFSSPSGKHYQGGFKDGKLNGYGVMIYPDGRHYEGEFKDNNRHGYGVMTYQDGGMYEEGSRYEGQFKDDKRHGQGIMIYLDDGRRLEGEFKEDVFIGG